MHHRTKQKVDRINQDLTEASQKLRILDVAGERVYLNNDRIVSKRIFTRANNADLLVNFDKIYASDKAEIDFMAAWKVQKSREGGINCQKKHPEIRRQGKQNLLNAIETGKNLQGIIDKYGEGWTWNKGLTAETNASVRRMAEARKGEGNPRYGYSYSEEEKKRISDRMKEKIKNGEFTPKSNNSRTRKDTKFNGILYRSSWEAWFVKMNPEFEYEKLRLPYEIDGENHIYIVDFVCHKTMRVAEVKPKCHLSKPENVAKIKALTNWALENNYDVTIVDENYIASHFAVDELKGLSEDIIKKLERAVEVSKKARN